MSVCMRVEDLAQDLDLEILERGKGQVCFSSAEISRPGLQFTGFYDHFDPRRVQVIGKAEMNYLYSLPEAALEERMERFMGLEIPCVICARGYMPPDTLLKKAKEHQVAVFREACNTDQAGHKVNNYLARRLSKTILTHGVLMDVYGVGVLIRGESGMGKSETALELIRAGQRLVADDVVEVSRVGDKLLGRAPEQTRHFMEVRGIGIVDVRYLFGVGAVLLEREIDLVIDLENYSSQEKYIRTGADSLRSVELLGMPVPQTVIPVSPGRNMATVIEVAARNFRLRQLGYNTGAQFEQDFLKGE